jgi:transcription elongation GreA/GreB family factor
MAQPPTDKKTTHLPDKQALKAALLQSLDDEINTALQSATTAQVTASDANNKPENQYDTLALEAAYLAHGQSERILGLQQMRIQVAKWPVPEFSNNDTVRTGAYVELMAEDDTEQALFIAPVGGRKLLANGRNVLVVSNETPLAKSLAGSGVGDEISLTLGGKAQHWEVLSLA